VENEGQTPYGTIQHINVADRRPSIFSRLQSIEHDNEPLLFDNDLERRLPAVDDDDDGLAEEPSRSRLPSSQQTLSSPEIVVRSPSSETLRSRKSSGGGGHTNARRGQDLF
jgi:hypothetical protein